MKELSIEEKARCYDEAIERAKVFKEHLLEINEKDYADEMDYIFPELKESEDERICGKLIAFLKDCKAVYGDGFKQFGLDIDDAIAWLEKQGEHTNFRNKIQIGDKVTRNEDGVLVNLSQLNRVANKQGEQKHQYISRPRYVGEEELLGTNKQGKCPFLKQELIDMGFAFTKDGDLAYPIHKIENKEFASWKPSEEQMVALKCAITTAGERWVCMNTKDLESLYEDLKKLKG